MEMRKEGWGWKGEDGRDNGRRDGGREEEGRKAVERGK
jgi:hypothetical protein